MESKKLYVDVAHGYDILIESGISADCGAQIKKALPRAKRLFIVSDTNVAPLYGDAVLSSVKAAGFTAALRTIPAGEASKSSQSLAALWEAMADFGLTRTDGVIALGGGVVGDLAGLAASTVLRGVSLVQMPTTLLSQVDSSVGGKTAIDLPQGKNLVGTFYQPNLVLMDPDVLDTLPTPVFMAGMAEVIKYGCIWSREFFEFLKLRPSRESLMSDISHILYTCCDIKRQVVAEDERDTGMRMILNFGHTVGHAFEKAGNYAKWSHGEAVAAGMVAAARLGAALGVTKPDVPDEIERILSPLGLPTAIPCAWEDISGAIGLDKKSAGDEITFILLSDIGEVRPTKLKKELVLRNLEKLYGG